MQDLEDYKTFILCYEGMPIGEPEILAIEQVSITVKSHPMIVESHLDTKLQIDAKQQKKNAKLHNRVAHSDIEVEQTIEE